MSDPSTAPAPRAPWPALRAALAAALGLALLSGGLGAGCLSAPEDACGAGKPCPEGQRCTEGVCLLVGECGPGRPCGEGEACTAAGACVPDDSCDQNRACEPGLICNPAGFCRPEEVCDGIDNDEDGDTDELPAAAVCAHPDHSKLCAAPGTGCACNEPNRFDVDGDPANGCERAVVGPALGTGGTEVVKVPGVGGDSGLEAFAVGEYGGVAWVAGGRVQLAPAGARGAADRISLGEPGETYGADQGAELALLEIYTGDELLPEPGANGLPPAPPPESILRAVVAERTEPRPALMLNVGAVGASMTRALLRRTGINDFGAPSVAFVGSRGENIIYLAVIAYGRADPNAAFQPLLWVVPIEFTVEATEEGDAFRSVVRAMPAVPIELGGAGDYRAEVAPLLLPGATSGTFQTVLVAALADHSPDGIARPRSEVRINTRQFDLDGGAMVQRSIRTDEVELPGIVTSHLAIPALGESTGVYVANLKRGVSDDDTIDPVALLTLRTDGTFARLDGVLDDRGQPVVAVDRLALEAEVLGFAGAGDEAQGAVCLPTFAATGATGESRSIGVVVAGSAGLQRAERLFDENISKVRVSAQFDGTFWSAWSRPDSGATSLRRAQAACR